MLFWKMRSKYYIYKMEKIDLDIREGRIGQKEGNGLWLEYAKKNIDLLKRVCAKKGGG